MLAHLQNSFFGQNFLTFSEYFFFSQRENIIALFNQLDNSVFSNVLESLLLMCQENWQFRAQNDIWVLLGIAE